MILNPYESVTDRIAEQGGPILTADQVENAIGATYVGSLSDSFWSAWDEEISSLTSFFQSVINEPEISRRLKEAE